MFSNMKVATRLSVAFAIVLLLLLAVVGLGVSRLALINEGLRSITEENNVEMAHALGMRSAAFETSSSTTARSRRGSHYRYLTTRTRRSIARCPTS